MSLKKIIYEPNLSDIVKSKKNKSYKRKSKPEQSNSKTLKRLRTKFLDKIKSYKKPRSQDSISEPTSTTESISKKSPSNIKVVDSSTDSKFDSEFNKSLEFLEQLSKEKQNTNEAIKDKKSNKRIDKRLNKNLNKSLNKNLNKSLNKNVRRQILHDKTIKNPSAYKHENVYLELPSEMREPLYETTTCVTTPPPLITTAEYVSNIEPKSSHSLSVQPSITIMDDTPYGVLKNGNKPTFRQWKKQQTIKNTGSSKKHSLVIDEVNINAQNTQRKEAMNQFKLQYNNDMNKPIVCDEASVDDIPCVRITKRQTIRYDLGKKHRKIGILIKNRETRKNTQNKLAKIKRTNLSQIKSTLREKNIIKIGCVAPPDVLRKLYEETIKCGDIENTSSDALIHNYMNDS